MAIAFRSSLGSSNGGATTIVMTLPAGVVNTDVLVMSITARGGTATTITTPGGWTLLGTAVTSTTNLKQAIFWRYASSEPASYTVTMTSAKASGVIICIAGASLVAPIAAQYAGQANASSATVSSPATGSWSTRPGMLLYFGGIATGTTAGTPLDMTAAANAQASGGSGSTRCTSGSAYRLFATTTGPISGQSATYGAAAVNIGHQIFIFEDAAPSVVLNTADATTFTATRYPTIEATVTDAEGTDSILEVHFNPGAEIWKNLPMQLTCVSVTNTGDVYGTSGSTSGDYKIWKLPAGSDTWENLAIPTTGTQTIRELSVNSVNGDIWVYVNNTTNIVQYLAGSPTNFVNHPVNNDIWGTIALNTTNGDVYIAGIQVGGIYKLTGGTGSFTLITGTPNIYWVDIAIDESNGNVYALAAQGGAASDLYLQTASTGDFVPQLVGSAAYQSVTVNPSNHDVYVSINPVDIYKLAGGVGPLIPQGITVTVGVALSFYDSKLYFHDPNPIPGFIGRTKDYADVFISGTDGGFLNTVNGGDASPFTSGQKVSYTFQLPLPNGTYTYKAMGRNARYGTFSEVRSFTVNVVDPSSSAKAYICIC